MLLLSNSDYVA